MSTRAGFLVSLLVLLTACGRGTQAELDALAARHTAPEVTRDGKFVLRRANGAEPESLDPHKAQSTTSAAILRDLYEGLISEAPDGTLIPGAAESWEVSPEGDVYTFHLRESAKWSNGAPVTAEDFAYGMRRAVDPKTASSYAQILAPILNAEAIIAGEQPPSTLGVEALDAHTLRIRLRGVTPYFLGLLTHSTAYPAYRPSIEKFGDRFTGPGNSVTNGAYVMREWVVQSHIVLQRNPQYWDNANTKIEFVKYFANENAEAEFKRYLVGELDTTSVPIPRIKWAKARLPAEYHQRPILSTYYYGLNLTRPPLDNPKLRMALSAAIDRRILTEKVTLGDEIPAYGWVPPGVANYTPQKLYWADWPREKQLEEARRLYREAGYGEKNPLHLELRYNTSENHKKIAAAVASMWKAALKMQVTIINEEWKVLLDDVNAKKVTEVYRAGWVGDYNDANTFAELMHSRFGLNGTGWSNRRYDALVDAAAVEKDPAKRQEELQQAEQILLADQPLIPIYFYVGKLMVKPYVKGYVGNIMEHNYSKDLWIEPAATK